MRAVDVLAASADIQMLVYHDLFGNCSVAVNIMMFTQNTELLED